MEDFDTDQTMHDTDFTDNTDDGFFVPLAKAQFFGSDGAVTSNVRQAEDSKTNAIFSRAGSLAPPYNPDRLAMIWEHSSALRQNIDAYCVNIDGFGHRFEPVIDLESDDVFEQVRDAMFLEALLQSDDVDLDGENLEIELGENIGFPSDEEVEQRIDRMEIEMRVERARIDAFFRFCCIDESFISLRKRTRQDREIFGYAFWEVLRSGKSGAPVQFTYVPAFSVRLLTLEKDNQKIIMKVKKSPLIFSEIEVSRRFRKFVQVVEGQKVYFKEFGDRRCMSANTGIYYKDYQELQKEERKDDDVDVPEATELIHFSISCPKSPYGMARWIGNMLAVVGSRQAEEINFLYFENKSIPPLAILVSGGSLSKNSSEFLSDYIKTHIKGRQNFHKILVIEGIPASAAALEGSAARMKIEIVPLTGAQQKDALFMQYDERNLDKIGMSFRLPRLLRGDTRDFNRATSESALEFTEMQVFAPERQDFDWFINRKILPDLGIKYWMFTSNGPSATNPLDLSKMISDLVKACILTPEEARELARAVFNRDFKKIDELWVKIPPDLLKSGIMPDGSEIELEGKEEEELEEQENPKESEEPEEEEIEKSRIRLMKKYRAGVRGQRLKQLAKDLFDLRQLLDRVEAEEAKRTFSDLKKDEPTDEPHVSTRVDKYESDSTNFSIEREIIEVPEDELLQFIEPHGGKES